MHSTVAISTLRIIQNGEVLGTGFLIAKDLVVTCAHVIVGREAIQVQFSGQEDVFTAQSLEDYYRDPG